MTRSILGDLNIICMKGGGVGSFGSGVVDGEVGEYFGSALRWLASLY